jgi:ferritin-like metal-binding protein YciE
MFRLIAGLMPDWYESAAIESWLSVQIMCQRHGIQLAMQGKPPLRLVAYSWCNAVFVAVLPSGTNFSGKVAGKEAAMTQQETVVSWLNDAYGMEHNLIRVLENHAKDTEGRPEMHAKFQQHLEQTRRHAELIKGCIERLGGSTSTIKTGISDVMGRIQGASTEPAKDELVKNVLADYASENFEIAAYRSLIAAAQAIGDAETVQVCETILQDEQEMAGWLEQQIPVVTQEFLGQQTRTHGA